MSVTTMTTLTAALHCGSTRARRAWNRYLAELYSELTEVEILAHEKVLRSGLMGSGDEPAPVDPAQAPGHKPAE